MQSLELSTAITEIEPSDAITAISDALLRLAKLYQVQNFDASNAILLAEWIIKEFKHKSLKLIIDTLDHPPVTFEDGQVSRNWRLTPDTIYLWVDKRAKEAEESRQAALRQSEQVKLLPDKDRSSNGNEIAKAWLEQLGKEMFQGHLKKASSPELERIDLMLHLLKKYKKESIDPITGKLYPDAMDERDWLLNKGYFIENGELKEV